MDSMSGAPENDGDLRLWERSGTSRRSGLLVSASFGGGSLAIYSLRGAWEVLDALLDLRLHLFPSVSLHIQHLYKDFPPFNI